MSATARDKNLSHDILIVDDEPDICLLVEGILSDDGLRTRTANSAEKALEAITARRPGLVLLDIWLEGSAMDGMLLLERIVTDHPGVPVIMMSGHGNIETAVAALKRGAYDFIEKPFKVDRLVLLVRHAIDSARLKRENQELRFRAGVDCDLVGQSPAITQVRQIIDRVAPSNSRVMILGESGVGKEITARAIHTKSRRADEPFIVVNCATLNHSQAEAELFGTDDGKATGGTSRKVGLFELAHGGTLYLDDVADMPADIQGKVVRVLQEQCFTRTGGTARIDIDVRVIASCTRDPVLEIEAGRLRQDLYYRLNVVPIMMPALVNRREDIPLLAQYFLAHAAESAGLPPRVLGKDALVTLQSHSWPGNVRQLRNVMEWLLIMAPREASEPISAEMLPGDIISASSDMVFWDKSSEIMALPLREARELFEREYLLVQITRFGGNISRTAGFVGMERSALHRKLRMLGIHGSDSDLPPVTEEKLRDRA